MSKDKKRSSAESARRIWLAGIGAYGRAFTEAQEAIKDVTGKGSEIFDELVQKGEMLETMGKAKGKEALEKANIPNFDMPDFDIDDRIKAMRSRLARSGDDPTVSSDYEDRLAAVETKLDKILALLEPKKPARKRVAKKAPSKKRATTQRTPKQTAKKAAPKK